MRIKVLRPLLKERTVAVWLQDVHLCAGCDLQDQAGLRGPEAVRLGCSQAQPQDAVARHSRGGGRADDLGAVLGAQHSQPELRVDQLTPQQRE